MENLQREKDYLLARLQYYENMSSVSPESSSSQHLPRAQGILEQLYHAQEFTMMDLAYIEANEESIPLAHREQTQGLIRSHMFRDWVVAPKSKELLIHGNFEGTHYVSALSLFCTTFIRGVQASDRFITLAFFCGRHLEGANTGGRSILWSLLTQLLHQHHFDARHLDKDVDMPLVETGDLQELTMLFRSLLLQLRNVTLTCIIEGVKYYERDEYIDDMAVVLRSLLDLTCDDGLGVVFKVMVTSDSPTHVVREAFSPSDVLSLDSTSGVAQGYSTAHVKRAIQQKIL